MSTDNDQSPISGARAIKLRFSLLALLVCVTIVCLILAWVMRPSKYVVTCLFQIDAVRPSIFGNTEFNEREFDSLRRTQLQLLKSHFLLQSALRNPKVAALPVIQSQEDPISWLQNLLEVDFSDGSEVLAIRMHCREDAINDYRAIVDSVAAAYLNDVVFAEDQYRLVHRDALAKSLSMLSAEVESKMDAYYSLTKDIETVNKDSARDIKDSAKDAVALQLMQAELNDLMEVKHKASIALHLFDLESNAPKRIKLIQPATAAKQ
jgi:hypothetical protein